MNVASWNAKANEADIDFNTFTIADAVDWAEFVEMVNDVDIEHEEE